VNERDTQLEQRSEDISDLRAVFESTATKDTVKKTKLQVIRAINQCTAQGYKDRLELEMTRLQDTLTLLNDLQSKMKDLQQEKAELSRRLDAYERSEGTSPVRTAPSLLEQMASGEATNQSAPSQSVPSQSAETSANESTENKSKMSLESTVNELKQQLSIAQIERQAEQSRQSSQLSTMKLQLFNVQSELDQAQAELSNLKAKLRRQRLYGLSLSIAKQQLEAQRDEQERELAQLKQRKCPSRLCF